MIGWLRGWRHAGLRRLLSTYVDGSASESERARVEAHLAGCEACRVEADSLRATIELLASLPKAVPSRSFALEREPWPAPSVSRLVWTARVAAPVAALLLVALVVGNAVGIIGGGDGLDLLGGMAADESIQEVPVEVIVEKEVVKEVPVERIVEVEKEVVRTVEVEKPVEVIKEVVKEVEVPGETVVVEVEKEVVREVIVEVVVTVEAMEGQAVAGEEPAAPEAMTKSAEPTQEPTQAAAAPAATPDPEPTELPAPTATSIPTPTAAPTPTATPTPTAVSTPTAAPTPTVTPTSTAVPTATAVPTPTAVPAPTPTSPPTPVPAVADRYDDAEGPGLPLWGIGVAVLLVLLAALAGGFWVARRGSGGR